MILKFWTNHAVNRNNINPWLLRRTWILLNFLSVTRSPAPLVTWRPTFWNNVVVSSAMFEMPKRLLPRNARYQIPSDAAPNLRIQGAWTATFFGGKVMYVYSVYSRKYLYEFCSELTVCIELLGKIREQRNTQTSNARWEAEKCRCVFICKIRHVHFITATTPATVTNRPEATVTNARHEHQLYYRFVS